MQTPNFYNTGHRAAWLVSCLAAVLLTIVGAPAAQAGPRAYRLGTEGAWIHGVSASGVWGISQSVGDRDVDNPQGVGGTLIDVATGSVKATIAGGSRYGFGMLYDVADDATVVGSIDYTPAVWHRDSGVWTALPLPDGYDTGAVMHITPDGRRAVGYAGQSSDISVATPVLYDLTTNAIIPTPGMPRQGMNGRNYNQNAPSGISADGRYILGMVAQSYMMDLGQSVMWAYIYDTATSTYTPIGWSIDADGRFIADFDGQNFIDCATMSRSGEWVTGMIRMARPVEGSEFANDYCTPFRYHTPDGTFEILDAEADHDVGGFAIDDSGTIYGASPWENPYCEGQVRSGRYFYSYSRIFADAYGYSLQSAIGDDLSGRPASISANGLVQAMRNGPDEGYMLILDEPLAAGAAHVDLLANHTAEPPSGAVMAKLRSVQLTFDRAIALTGNPADIKVLDSAGTVVASALQSTAVLASNDHVLSIGLRTLTMAAGQTYTIQVPAGMVSLLGDDTVKNRPITLRYTGRGTGAVAVTSVYPADGASVARLDSSTNPIVLTFDSQVRPAEGATPALLYEAGYHTPKATLTASVSGNALYLYPASTQHLFAGTDYRVEIPAGLVTDLSGEGPSEALTLNYKGVYVREVNADDTYLFRADGSVDAFLQFLTFDGDELEPADEPASWGFTSATPWWGVLSGDNSSDLAFASHSMYAGDGGRSDDWLMTPQLYIADDNVTLSFDLQGYRFDADDYLTVYVYPCAEGYNNLTRALADDIRANGHRIYHEKAYPGASMGNLEGEWTHVSLPLADYAGSDVYIAFVNENDRQSALFLDNVEVMRNVDFTLAFLHPSTVVGRSEIDIEGRINVTSEARTFSSVTLTLTDGEGNIVGTLAESGLTLQRGDTYAFRFAQPLPLAPGAENEFTLEVALDDVHTRITDRVKNLAFQPHKRVVLEEYTGSECGNCPLGILAIDHLKEMYPSNFIAITLRCYQGDMLGAHLQGYASFLGLQAAPSGLIDRDGTVYHPAVSAGGDYSFAGQGMTDSDGNPVVLWADAVAAHLEEPAEADVEFAAEYDPDTRSLTIPVEVRFALSTTDRALKLLAVVLEDQLTTYQVNYLNTVDDPDLLPWSMGGALAEHITAYTFDDVARGVIGRTYSGTAGLLPADIAGGSSYYASLSGELPAQITAEKAALSRVVVMLIDDITGRIVNANVAPVGGATDGISAVSPDTPAAAFTAAAGRVSVSDPTAPLEIYSLDGRLIARGRGTASLGGFRGIAIARSGASVAKLHITE